MEITYSLNEFLYKVLIYSKNRYRRYRVNKVIKIRKGLPGNIDQRLINKVCKHHFQSEVHSTKFQKLSGWKRTGTYRLFITLRNNQRKQLIYRHCSYNYDDFPALKGYPVTLGPVEFVIGNVNNESINDFLPTTLWSNHDKDDVYRYITEDLTTRNYKARMALGESIVFHLLSLNQALNNSNLDKNLFPKYDMAYSQNLIGYISALWDHSWETKYNLSYQKLKSISDVYLEIASQERRTGLIHGDFNESNILFKYKNGRYILKVVDWEWAGIGTIHSDLAAYFRSANHPHLNASLNELAKLQPWETYEYHYKWMYWAFLDRAFLDLSYMIAQREKAIKYSTFNIDRFINESAMDLREAHSKIQPVFNLV